MMTAQFEQIAREGIIKDMVDKLGSQVTPAQARAMVSLNIIVNNVMQDMIKKHQPRSMEDILSFIRKSAVEAFKQCADKFRQDNDWEAYGAIQWLSGSMGIPL